jgi:hypothetical protein
LSGKKASEISAGAGKFSVAGGGGSVAGGVGVISIVNRQTAYTIKKELIPVNRPAGGGANFNPYGLMLNDVIQIKLIVASPEPGMVIKDDFLDSGGYICDNPSDISPGGTEGSGYISWVFGQSTEFYYQCTVRNK